MTLSAAIKTAGQVSVSNAQRGASCNLGPRGRQFAKLNSQPSLQKNSFQGCKLASRAPLVVTSRRAGAQILAANVVSDVGKYLSEAASAIFKPTGDNTVPWSGTGAPFEGRIQHHDEVARLRELYTQVKTARETLVGCTDPSASNFNASATADDGTCTYIASDPNVGNPESLHTYITGTLGRLWGNNFKGDENEPDWKGTEFSFGGDIVSQRDIQRLLQYETVVKKTLEKAEEKVGESEKQ